MKKPRNFVPPAVAQCYSEIAASAPKGYSKEERACFERLVTDERMREVYKALKFAEQGWRLFFYFACTYANIDARGIRKDIARVYELLPEIEKTAKKLARALESFEDVGGGLEDPEMLVDPDIKDLDILPLMDLVALLRETGKDNADFEYSIEPHLRQICTYSGRRNLPSLPSLLRTLAQIAGEVHRCGQFGTGRLRPPAPLFAAAAGRQHSQLAAYRGMLIDGCRRNSETREVVKKLSDRVIAALASVALDKDFSEGAVKKIRQRDKSHKKS